MPAQNEIRADFDRDSIVVYQAFSPAIADVALAAQRFIPPFSLQRMTWIKPSFLWLMHRSNWGLKRGQERILAVRITRDGWERALSLAVSTSFSSSLFPSPADWESRFRSALVHLQWDPERSLRGAALPYNSIQIGLSRHIIGEYVEGWVIHVDDYTPRARKLYELLQSGRGDEAKRHLPAERLYPVDRGLAQRLLVTS